MAEHQIDISQDKALIQIDAAYRAIAEAKTLEDVMDIRDKASAAGLYLKIHSRSLDDQNRAATVKLRAERRLGEFLAEIDRQGPGRPAAGGNPPTLGGLNIGYNEASRWQLEARVSETDFCNWLADLRSRNAEITSAAFLRLAKALLSSGKKDKKKEKQEWTAMVFRVPPDEVGTVEKALRGAQKITGSEDPGTNLVGICQEFLAGVRHGEGNEGDA